MLPLAVLPLPVWDYSASFSGSPKLLVKTSLAWDKTEFEDSESC